MDVDGTSFRMQSRADALANLPGPGKVVSAKCGHAAERQLSGPIFEPYASALQVSPGGFFMSSLTPERRIEAAAIISALLEPQGCLQIVLRIG